VTVWWEWVTAFLSALGAIIGSTATIKRVSVHEQEACDLRLEAFREGMDRERAREELERER